MVYENVMVLIWKSLRIIEKSFKADVNTQIVAKYFQLSKTNQNKRKLPENSRTEVTITYSRAYNNYCINGKFNDFL